MSFCPVQISFRLDWTVMESLAPQWARGLRVGRQAHTGLYRTERTHCAYSNSSAGGFCLLCRHTVLGLASTDWLQLPACCLMRAKCEQQGKTKRYCKFVNWGTTKNATREGERDCVYIICRTIKIHGEFDCLYRLITWCNFLGAFP